MSASAHNFLSASCDQKLLGELLHSLSQPLTSLRCSLELSLDETAEQQRYAASALQQTETAIAMVQLMREYLNADSTSRNVATPLAPTLRSVCDDLASIAAVRNVRLRVVGSCSAQLHIAAPALRLALQYLLLMMIECQPPRCEITLLLGEGRRGAELRTQADWGLSHIAAYAANSPSKTELVQETMKRTRLAIAVRIFEAGGARLVFDDGIPGFVLRIPLQSRDRI